MNNAAAAHLSKRELTPTAVPPNNNHRIVFAESGKGNAGGEDDRTRQRAAAVCLYLSGMHLFDGTKGSRSNHHGEPPSAYGDAFLLPCRTISRKYL